jgi:hypothetical protein
MKSPIIQIVSLNMHLMKEQIGLWLSARVFYSDRHEAKWVKVSGILETK